jgi:hypothetical protein
MFRTISVILVCAIATFEATWASPPSEVTVVATMHGLHAKSRSYSYQTLYDLVRRFHPDYVGVEIRQEDLARSPDYLAHNYPKEMVDLTREWGSRAFGFDWLGDDVANAAVPDDWWAKRSPIKQLERELDKDAAYKSKQLDAIQAEELGILDAATPASLNDGRYDQLNDEFYLQFGKLVSGSRYEMLADFYAERDRHLASNIVAAIKAHPGARFAILTGADHRSAILRTLRASLDRTINIVPVSLSSIP